MDEVTGRIAGFLVHNVADATRAHIHLGARGTAGGIRVNLTRSTCPAPPCTPFRTTHSSRPPRRTWRVTSRGISTSTWHNPAFPAGVIRGQIDITPTSIRFASLDNTQETTGSDSTGKGGGLFRGGRSDGKDRRVPAA